MFLINVSNALRHSISWILIAIASMVVGIRLIRRIGFLKTLGDRIALKLPVFGEIVRKTAVARFSRTLGTLVASGVPILQSFSIVRETVGNRVVANAIGEVHDSVREGESIAGPLERSNAFPYMAVNMIDVGEETGNLDAMLLKIADIYDSEVDASIGAMLQIIEPAMVVVLGLIVGFIVVAMYLPIINMAGFI
jgi:type IV pilus assembly protein PilC